MGWMNLGVDFDQHLVTNNRDRTGEMTRDVVDAVTVFSVALGGIMQRV
jgi:hypothetical protein